jgi:hypothetical protein
MEITSREKTYLFILSVNIKYKNLLQNDIINIFILFLYFYLLLFLVKEYVNSNYLVEMK